MANLMDYLDWRGDLTLAQSPFNEVDNLILAELSFVDFQGIVPGVGEGESVPLAKAAESFLARFPAGEKIDMGVLVPGAIPEMLEKMAASRRFGDMGLNCFVDHLDVGRGEQFAALTVETGDGMLYLSFRGTDDGPGFHEDLLDLPEHKRIAERIYSIVPKSSVVGMLLEHEEDYAVVDSDQLGFLQHDGFSWQVIGDHFLTLRQVTRQARLSDMALREWVHGMPGERREEFVSALFDVLSASGAVTLKDLKADSFKAAGAMVKAMKDLDKETREGLLNFVGLLFKSNLLMTLEGIQEETEKRRAVRKKAAKKKEEEA